MTKMNYSFNEKRNTFARLRIMLFLYCLFFVFFGCHSDTDIVKNLVGNNYKLDSVVLYKDKIRQFRYDSSVNLWVFESETLHFGDDKIITSETVENGEKIVRKGFYKIQNDTLIVYTKDSKGNREKIFRLDENSFYTIMELKISKDLSDFNYLYYSKIEK